MSLTDEKVDEALEAVLTSRQVKVARVIADTSARLVESGYLSAGEQYDEGAMLRIEKRLLALAEGKRIVVFGNLQDWRHCEVKLNDQN